MSSPFCVDAFERSEVAMKIRDVEFAFSTLAAFPSHHYLDDDRSIAQVFNDLPGIMSLARDYGRSTYVEGSLDSVIELWAASRGQLRVFDFTSASWRLLIYLLRHHVKPDQVIHSLLKPYITQQWRGMNFFALGYLIGSGNGGKRLAAACWTYIVAGNGFYLLNVLPWDVNKIKEALEGRSPEIFWTAASLCLSHQGIEHELLRVSHSEIS